MTSRWRRVRFLIRGNIDSTSTYVIKAINARSLQKKGLSEDALQESIILVEQEPDEPQHLVIAGDALSSMGRKDEAVARYEQALELPYSIDIMLRLGGVTGHDSWLKMALDKCDELMVETDDDHSYTLFLKADVLRRLGLEDVAQEVEDMALQVIERLYED